MQNFDELFGKPAFSSLGPERKAMFKSLGERIEGKGNIEALSIIADFMKNMPQDKQPTPSEQEAMIEAFMDTMPEKDRARLKIIINLMKGRQ
jgi:hypothetical protein